MGSSGRYVFRATRDAHTQITELFDFVHPTAIAMWNLRWQVQGFVANVPDAGASDLEGRFARGSNLGSGSLKRATLETPWENQLEQFASIILINAIAAFEDFTANLAVVRFLDTKKQRNLSDSLQFPSMPVNPDRPDAMSLVGSPSSLLDGAIARDKSILRRYVPGAKDDLLRCYRFFKEIRNAIAHNGRRANARTLDAYQTFVGAIVNDRIGGAPVPDHSAITAIGDPVRISYRGLVGFSDIVLRILTTYDIELSKFSIVEQELVSRVRPDLQTWPTDEKKKAHRIRKLIQTDDFPIVTVTPDLETFLRDRGFVPRYA